VVIVDERYIRKVLGEFVGSRFDYQVEMAERVDVARVTIQATQFDLIILDLNMPGTSSLYRVDVLNNDPRYRDVPVFIVLSMGFDSVTEAFQQRGAGHFFRKLDLTRDGEHQQQVMTALEEALPLRATESLANNAPEA